MPRFPSGCQFVVLAPGYYPDAVQFNVFISGYISAILSPWSRPVLVRATCLEPFQQQSLTFPHCPLSSLSPFLIAHLLLPFVFLLPSPFRFPIQQSIPFPIFFILFLM